MALTKLYVNKIIDDKFLNDGLSLKEKQDFVERYKDAPIQKIEPKAIEAEYEKYSAEMREFKTGKNVPIYQLGIKERTNSMLLKNNICTIDELCTYTKEQLLSCYGIGTKSINDIVSCLKVFGLNLRKI